jgi:anti-anti-sigma regulatory factor
MTLLKIERATDGDVVVFTLSGRIEGERLAELQSLFASAGVEQRIVLDLHEVDLVDREAVRFLARCAADGIQLEQCPAYIREWIVRETLSLT